MLNFCFNPKGFITLTPENPHIKNQGVRSTPSLLVTWKHEQNRKMKHEDSL